MGSRRITAEMVVSAYCQGAFPMASSRRGAIGWYSPDPRTVLPLDGFHMPRGLRRALKKRPYVVTRDEAFEEVIRGCAEPRGAEGETWISEEIVRVYCELHRAGLAHSVEAWGPAEDEGREAGGAEPPGGTGPGAGGDAGSEGDRPVGWVMVGGLYGVALGAAFFGESMFTRRTDASKICLVHLVEHLRAGGYSLLDVQLTNPHLMQFGIEEVPRKEYLRRLAEALGGEGRW